ncbi:hypothetical protein [Rhizobium sp. RAF56]|uniref:hypothetical protein n=1 Tax=Rhizobium sp. RAF56 TaxID=3233062 RepID=UPI003F987946
MQTQQARSLPPQFTADFLAKYPAVASLLPSVAHGRPIPLKTVELMLGEGLLPPSALKLLGEIEVVPHFRVDADVCRWDADLRKVIYHHDDTNARYRIHEPDPRLMSPSEKRAYRAGKLIPEPHPDTSQDFVPLSRIAGAFNPEARLCGWFLASNMPPNVTTLTSYSTVDKFSHELRCTIRVEMLCRETLLPDALALPTPSQLRQPPADWGGAYFIATAVDPIDVPPGQATPTGWRVPVLVDDDDPCRPPLVPVFHSRDEACRLAEMAVLAEDTIPDGWDEHRLGDPPRLRWLIPQLGRGWKPATD